VLFAVNTPEGAAQVIAEVGAKVAKTRQRKQQTSLSQGLPQYGPTENFKGGVSAR